MRRFYLDHLSSEDRKATRCAHVGVLALYCSAILLLAAVVQLSAPPFDSVMFARASLAETRHLGGLFSAVAAERPDLTECAARDLKVLTTLGEHGEAQDVPGDAIAAAFFALVKARAACAAGSTTEGLAIYDSISLVSGRPAKKRD